MEHKEHPLQEHKEKEPVAWYDPVTDATCSATLLQDLVRYKTLPQITKHRIGRDNDGGYIVCKLPINYNILLSCGIADDTSFEEQFHSIHQCHVLCFDGTIGGLPNPNAPIDFVKKNIGVVNSPTTTNLTNYIDEFIKHMCVKLPNIFIKMDIEGHEIEWINSLDEKYFEYFQQIVIEFHWPYSPEAAAAIKKLNKHMRLVHLHGNNACGMRTHLGTHFPNVFECTFIKKQYCINEINYDPIPGPLDMPNMPHLEDLKLSF